MKERDEPPLRHSELNEVVIDHFKNNFSWKMERESLDAGRRSAMRQLSESSGPYHNMSVNP